MLVLRDSVACLHGAPAGAERLAARHLVALGIRRRPELDQLIDMPALRRRDGVWARSCLFGGCWPGWLGRCTAGLPLQRADPRLQLAPRLPRLLLALLERALSVGDTLNGTVEALQVAQVLDVPALTFRQARRAGDRVVDVPNREEAEIAQAFLD